MGAESRDDSISVPATCEGIRDDREKLLDDLVPAVEQELRRIAHSLLRRQPEDPVLQTTFLVNEAYVRLARANGRTWVTPEHLLGLVVTAMRHILVDHARKRKRRREMNAERTILDILVDTLEKSSDDLIELDLALRELELQEPALARIVEYRFYGGRSMNEISLLLGVSLRTIERDWQFARAWLGRRLRKGLSP